MLCLCVYWVDHNLGNGVGMQKALPLLVAVFTVLARPGTVVAQDFQKGVEAFQAGDHVTTLREYRELAEKGDVDAQVALGVMYEEGKGVPQDYAEAAKWYRLAARQGDARAPFSLGMIYEFGKGVAQDLISAHMWFNIAAASGDSGAEGDRDSLEPEMTTADIAKAEMLAREWMHAYALMIP